MAFRLGGAGREELPPDAPGVHALDGKLQRGMQAGLHPAVRRQAQAVATGAKRGAQRRYQSNPALGAWQAMSSLSDAVQGDRNQLPSRQQKLIDQINSAYSLYTAE